VLVSATFVHSFVDFFKTLIFTVGWAYIVHMLAFCQVNVLNEYDDDDNDDHLYTEETILVQELNPKPEAHPPLQSQYPNTYLL